MKNSTFLRTHRDTAKDALVVDARVRSTRIVVVAIRIDEATGCIRDVLALSSKTEVCCTHIVIVAIALPIAAVCNRLQYAGPIYTTVRRAVITIGTIRIHTAGAAWSWRVHTGIGNAGVNGAAVTVVAFCLGVATRFGFNVTTRMGEAQVCCACISIVAIRSIDAAGWIQRALALVGRRVTNIRCANVSVVAVEVRNTTIGDIRMRTGVVRSTRIGGAQYSIIAVRIGVTPGRVWWVPTETILAFIQCRWVTIRTFSRGETTLLVWQVGVRADECIRVAIVLGTVVLIVAIQIIQADGVGMTAIWVSDIRTITTLVRDTCIDIARHTIVAVRCIVAAVGLFDMVAGV